jgi:carboxypeptidase C (cathepsin A)
LERWYQCLRHYQVQELSKYKILLTAAALVEEYFKDPEVKKIYALSDDVEFGKQSGDVYKKLFSDFMKNEVALVEYCLSKKLPLLIYNGQNDLIVENPGTMRWVEQIHYAESGEFRQTLFKTWKVNGKVAGSVKKAGLLEFRIVNNAGHLVPMDQGANALEMVKSFVEPLRNTTKLAD